ncbi:MAG: histidinol-phosphate transaminase [Clostridiales Family XIII bacterium]|jgi:histidinol-phosphate aminotransferase|nr:histidinol-phosphate transaminase [Clostridiales Family XIII bacterium]
MTRPTIESLTNPGVLKNPPYIPGDTAESVTKKYNLTKILKLASNENQLGSSPKALEALRAEVDKSNIYPDPFSESLRAKLAKRYGLTSDNVIVTTGGSGSISLVADVFITAGDEAVICEPTFSLFESACVRAGANIVKCGVTEDGSFDLDAISAAVTDRTKLVYICNPNNPTGGTIEHDALLAFTDSLPAHVIVIIDEAYISFATDPGYGSLADAVNDERRLIVMRTFSKDYGLAALRIGYLLTSTEIHSMLMRAVNAFLGSRPGLSAALAALDDEEFLQLSVQTVVDGRKYLTGELEKLGFRVFPSQSNFIYVDTGFNTADFAEKCKTRGLIIRGNFEFNRISIGTSEQNEQVVEIVKAVLADGVAPRS